MDEAQVYAMLQDVAEKANVSLQKLKIGESRLFAGHVAVANDSVNEDEMINKVCFWVFN